MSRISCLVSSCLVPSITLTLWGLALGCDDSYRYYDDGADEVCFLNITSFRQGVIDDLPMLKVLPWLGLREPGGLLWCRLGSLKACIINA